MIQLHDHLVRRVTSRTDRTLREADAAVRQMVEVLDLGEVPPEDWFIVSKLLWVIPNDTTIAAGGVGLRSKIQVWNNSQVDEQPLVVVVEVFNVGIPTTLNIELRNSSAAFTVAAGQTKIADRQFGATHDGLAPEVQLRTQNNAATEGSVLYRVPRLVGANGEPFQLKHPLFILAPQTGCHADPGADNTALTAGWSGYSLRIATRK